MGFVPLDMFQAITPNRYKAVIVATKRARQINSIRLAKLEMLSAENAENVEIDGRKVTFVAIKDCLEGRVKIQRKDN